MKTKSPYGNTDGIKNVLMFLDDCGWQFDMDYDEMDTVNSCFYLTHPQEGDLIEYDVQHPEDLWIDHNKLIGLFDEIKIFDYVTMGAVYMGKYQKRILKIIRSKYKIPDDTEIV